MSNMHELKEIFSHLNYAWQKNEQTVLVILTNVRGSAYRLPGSKMLMTSSGNMFGTVSGGCLEADLYGWAEKVFETRKPFIHDYDLSDKEIWSLGIGCKGDLQFLFLPIEPNQLQWQRVNELVQQDKGFSLVVEMESGDLAILEEHEHSCLENSVIPKMILQEAQQSFTSQTRAKVASFEQRQYLIDAVKTSERLIIAGAGQDAMPVAELAHQAGFSVTIIDSRSHFNNEKRFPHATHITDEPENIPTHQLNNSWWVIMNHHQQKDEEILKLAIESFPKYVGVLGPTYRTNEMLENVGYEITSGPIYSPLGLDIGAETMYEVAISIVSELMSVRCGRVASSLHGRTKIHV